MTVAEDQAKRILRDILEMIAIAEDELRKEREEHAVTKGVCYSILRALGHDTISVRQRGLSQEQFERLIAAAARIRNYEGEVGLRIAAYNQLANTKDYGTGEKAQAQGIAEGLRIAGTLYKGTERHPEPPPTTGTYLDSGFIPNDLHVILEMTSRYLSTYDRESRYTQVHLILTQIANHADLRAEFARCVNELVGELRQQHATEISPAPPKAN